MLFRDYTQVGKEVGAYHQIKVGQGGLNAVKEFLHKGLGALIDYLQLAQGMPHPGEFFHGFVEFLFAPVRGEIEEVQSVAFNLLPEKRGAGKGHTMACPAESLSQGDDGKNISGGAMGCEQNTHRSLLDKYPHRISTSRVVCLTRA